MKSSYGNPLLEPSLRLAKWLDTQWVLTPNVPRPLHGLYPTCHRLWLWTSGIKHFSKKCPTYWHIPQTLKYLFMVAGVCSRVLWISLRTWILHGNPFSEAFLLDDGTDVSGDSWWYAKPVALQHTSLRGWFSCLVEYFFIRACRKKKTGSYGGKSWKITI